MKNKSIRWAGSLVLLGVLFLCSSAQAFQHSPFPQGWTATMSGSQAIARASSGALMQAVEAGGGYLAPMTLVVDTSCYNTGINSYQTTTYTKSGATESYLTRTYLNVGQTYHTTHYSNGVKDWENWEPFNISGWGGIQNDHKVWGVNNENAYTGTMNTTYYTYNQCAGQQRCARVTLTGYQTVPMVVVNWNPVAYDWSHTEYVFVQGSVAVWAPTWTADTFVISAPSTFSLP